MKLKQEYKQALIKIARLSDTTKEEIQIGNLILKYFDEILPLGTAHGKRAYKISDLIEKYAEEQPVFVEDGDSIKETKSKDIIKLSSLELESFRGFSNSNVIPMNDLTLIYGPNGSGKSSICEALEFALLGNVKEANSKRIPPEEYLVNKSNLNFKPPTLKCKYNNSETEELIITSIDNFEFSFIEKNRINDFARISSHAPSSQKNLLATLFGLDDFSAFVDNFTARLNEYIRLSSPKEEELLLKKESIKIEKTKARTAIEELRKLADANKIFIEAIGLCGNSEELDYFLHGNGQEPGRIGEIDDELQKEKPQKIEFITSGVFFEKIDNLKLQYETLDKLEKRIIEASREVNFKKLYEAAIQLKNEDPDICPLCKTYIHNEDNFNGVHVCKNNPYDIAESGLKSLKELDEIQQKISDIKTKISDNLPEVKVAIKNYVKIAKELELDSKESWETFLVKDDYIFNIESVKLIEDGRGFVQEVCESAVSFNNNIDKIDANRKKLNEEKNILIEFSNILKGFSAEKNIRSQDISNARKNLAKFRRENQSLYDQVILDKKVIDRNKRYLHAYHSFRNKLINYKNELPLSMAKNLGGNVKKIYNHINAHDKEFELIETINLPVLPNESINIKFRGQPDNAFNALDILSEGHIRCLGLSILIAKSLEQGNSFIIFDDIINAIDDDHRSGIRSLLIEYLYNKQIQIILASHAEEFIKDIENMVPQNEYYKKVSSVCLLPLDAFGCVIVSQANPRKYLIKAANALGNQEKRESLRYCRPALENLTGKLWKKISKTYSTNIAVTIRIPKTAPDLMSVVQGLRKKIYEINADDLNGYVDILDNLLEIESRSNRIWTYLNKGTHEEEDRGEFEYEIVKDVYEILQRFDTMLG